MNNNQSLDKVIFMAKEMRKDMVRMGFNAGDSGAHMGGSLSLAEIMAVLYSQILRFDPDNPHYPDRDRLILSKGHGAMALYAAMSQVGLIDAGDLKHFKKSGHWMTVHPLIDISRRMECSSGSLGQGLSFAIGASLALVGKPCRFFVILGDGECNEGQVWEAAMFAAHHKLNNLIVIVDANGVQYDGTTREVLDMEILGAKWAAFNWDVIELDGHDVYELNRVLTENTSLGSQRRPLAIIAHTIKGKGVSFMENAPMWHHGRLSAKQYEQAMCELGGDDA